MPMMNGFEATARTRQTGKHGSLQPMPIVALTAGAFEEDRLRCSEAGMDDFLSKPLDIKELARLIEKWLVG